MGEKAKVRSTTEQSRSCNVFYCCFTLYIGQGQRPNNFVWCILLMFYVINRAKTKAEQYRVMYWVIFYDVHTWLRQMLINLKKKNMRFVVFITVYLTEGVLQKLPYTRQLFYTTLFDLYLARHCSRAPNQTTGRQSGKGEVRYCVTISHQ